jgi:hypothetical protein
MRRWRGTERGEQGDDVGEEQEGGRCMRRKKRRCMRRTRRWKMDEKEEEKV